jgi:type I restriction enzyme S subunit
LLSKLNPRIPRIWAPSHIPTNAVCSTEFLVLIPRDGIDRDFLTVVCRSPAMCYQMELHAIGTTGSHQRVNPSQALTIKVSIPIDKAEQAAIAAVLSDMDAEIAALEVKLAKSRSLKQGMMQELLTGRIRLI